MFFLCFQEPDTKEQSPAAEKETEGCFTKPDTPADVDEYLHIASSDDIIGSIESGSEDFIKSDESLGTETEGSSSDTDTVRYILGTVFINFCISFSYHVLKTWSQPRLTLFPTAIPAANS